MRASDGALYIGLMSGTSLDGIDAVLVAGLPGRSDVAAHHHQPFDTALRTELLALNSPGGADELPRAARAANAVADAYAQAAHALLAAAGLAPGAVRALGAHGQTVRHQPDQGWTVQLLSGARLAEATGIDVVCDFRARDVAAGGQGAPLVPAFHQARFGGQPQTAVLNLGGIANLSLLGAAPTGFDCGPANVLLDAWVARHRPGTLYDADGAWAASGQVLPALLARLRAEPYFALPPPRSTGRDRFHLAWLDAHLAQEPPARPQDVQATLLALTTTTIAADLRAYAPATQLLIVCGGGTLNRALMAALRAALPGVRVEASDAHGLPAMQVEATAFAWLAARFMQGLPGNLPAVTGALGERVLGCWYPSGHPQPTRAG
ncbi:MAG: anhydro-N-acetylmuramic acid kinase [Proteobacteria bacterium]|nr:anhydro-N-acetylmuramic acid kinase [Pseudomonadota bacterium]